jgi:hypothetical protein
MIPSACHCQSRHVFATFSQGTEFRDALAEGWLPPPRPGPPGEVSDARARDGAAP